MITNIILRIEHLLLRLKDERWASAIYMGRKHIQTKAFSSSIWAIQRKVVTESEAVLIFDYLLYLAAWL